MVGIKIKHIQMIFLSMAFLHQKDMFSFIVSCICPWKQMLKSTGRQKEFAETLWGVATLLWNNVFHIVHLANIKAHDRIHIPLLKRQRYKKVYVFHIQQSCKEEKVQTNLRYLKVCYEKYFLYFIKDTEQFVLKISIYQCHFVLFEP